MISSANLSSLNAIPYILGLIVLILILILSLWSGKSESEFEKKSEFSEKIFIIILWFGIVFCIIKVIFVWG